MSRGRGAPRRERRTIPQLTDLVLAVSAAQNGIQVLALNPYRANADTFTGGTSGISTPPAPTLLTSKKALQHARQAAPAHAADALARSCAQSLVPARAVCPVCCRMLGSVHDAEDALRSPSRRLAVPVQRHGVLHPPAGSVPRPSAAAAFAPPGSSVLDRFDFVSQVHVRLALDTAALHRFAQPGILRERAGRVDGGELNRHHDVVGILDGAIQPMALSAVLAAPGLILVKYGLHASKSRTCAAPPRRSSPTSCGLWTRATVPSPRRPDNASPTAGYRLPSISDPGGRRRRRILDPAPLHRPPSQTSVCTDSLSSGSPHRAASVDDPVPAPRADAPSDRTGCGRRSHGRYPSSAGQNPTRTPQRRLPSSRPDGNAVVGSLAPAVRPGHQSSAHAIHHTNGPGVRATRAPTASPTVAGARRPSGADAHPGGAGRRARAAGGRAHRRAAG